MVVAVQTAFAGDHGCPVPNFNVSASLALFPFNISATNKRLVFFYNCTVPAEFRLVRLCGNHTMGELAYISDRSWDAGEGGTPPHGVSTNCSSVSVPVRQEMERAQLHYDYVRLIMDGFLLKLPGPTGDCDRCTQMSGWESFQCVCPDADGKLCTPSNPTIRSGYLPGHHVNPYVVTTHSDGCQGAYGYWVCPMGDGSAGYLQPVWMAVM